MKTVIKIVALTALAGLFTISAFAQRPQQKSSNPFLDRDFWETKPSIEKIEATQKEGHSLTEANGGGFDATTFAIFSGNSLETIAFLLSQGNDVNKRTHDSRTYVFWAASRGNLEAVKYLVEKGSKLDLVDSHGYGPLSLPQQQVKKIQKYMIF